MQDAVDELLDGEGIQGFGLEVMAIDVSADLDPEARQALPRAGKHPAHRGALRRPGSTA